MSGPSDPTTNFSAVASNHLEKSALNRLIGKLKATVKFSRVRVQDAEFFWKTLETLDTLV